jgi:hypothetical protein
MTSQNTQNVDVTNIKDRGTLESVIYGNYSETAKIQAYNITDSRVPLSLMFVTSTFCVF